MKKILYVILHGSMHEERYYNIVNTWGKDVDHIFYSDHEDLDKKIFKVSDRTDYHSNEEKHINSLKYVNENFNQYEWFFFCDNDTFVNTKKLLEYIETADTELVHGSVLKETWPIDLTLEYCSGGAGYLIHHTILNKIIETIDVLNTGYSDVTLGLKLKDIQIQSKNSNLFNSQPPSFYDIDKPQIKNYISFHYIKNYNEMNELYNIINEL